MKYEVNKYPPAKFRHGKFLREEWTSCGDIGRVDSPVRVDRDEYLRVENLYVMAINEISKLIQPELLRVRGLEFWEASSDQLSTLGLADVFDGAVAPDEGEHVSGARLDNIARRCLREVAWCELWHPPTLLVHFGYDLRLIVAATLPLTEVLDKIRHSGLFVYESDAPLNNFNVTEPRTTKHENR
jgi:hypothetical protein